MSSFSALQLAPVGVSLLTVFLSYGSQILFPYIEPFVLEQKKVVIFNVLVGCTWICYARACLTSPGNVPSDWKSSDLEHKTSNNLRSSTRRQRWCKRCEAFKPPRAHHCKTCKRCILKMDHHCPWTINCVSHRTFPHFIRFLFYAVVSMGYLETLLYARSAVIWKGRNLPSYLGPSPTQLVFIFAFVIVNSTTLFVLSIILVRSLWSLGSNVTTIESWEIERHRTLLRRARVLGGSLDGPDGLKVRIVKQEFPYDIGIWQNISQGMGGGCLSWLWPFATTPRAESGLKFDVNGFEDPSTTWPPPDPDRISRHTRELDITRVFIHNEHTISSQEQIEAFHTRQAQDLNRVRGKSPLIARRKPFRERYGDDNLRYSDQQMAFPGHDNIREGEEAWRDSEGDRLGDFGVDEDAEFYDEDDIPLAQLLQKRRNAANFGRKL